ncbi:hypothetical protein COO60DRAFT_1479386 [Scenedesmus sp. NREL 46B-D3]|nr:hypothetical protein COO60DRAFT_1479386 [Scenedesmus sp. NREL 46B-D3]
MQHCTTPTAAGWPAAIMTTGSCVPSCLSADPSQIVSSGHKALQEHALPDGTHKYTSALYPRRSSCPTCLLNTQTACLLHNYLHCASYAPSANMKQGRMMYPTALRSSRRCKLDSPPARVQSNFSSPSSLSRAAIGMLCTSKLAKHRARASMQA